jgi:Flp pilus assembly protein TadG
MHVGNALRLKAASIRAALRQLVSGENSTRGASAIEFAIIAPVLIVAAVCTIDVGMGFYRNLQVQSAAHIGGQYAALHGYDATNISTAITNATSYSGISASPAPAQFCGCATTTGITVAGCGTQCPGGVVAGSYVTASAQSTYTTILPYPIMPNSFALSAQSTVRIQ